MPKTTRFEFSNRQIAERGDTIFDGYKFLGNPCRKCGEPARLISSHACVACLKKRPRPKRKNERNNTEILNSGQTLLSCGRKFVGTPCRACGNTVRYVYRARCVPCWDKKRKIYRVNKLLAKDTRHKGRIRRAQMEGYRPPPHEDDCEPCPSDWRCEICGDKTRRRPALEHCHVTGKFRGWVCARCNGVLAGLDRCGHKVYIDFQNGNRKAIHAHIEYRRKLAEIDKLNVEMVKEFGWPFSDQHNPNTGKKSEG